MPKINWRKVWDKVWQEVLPDRYSCWGCGDELVNVTREGLCPQCLPRLNYVGDVYCLKCGKPILPEGQDVPLPPKGENDGERAYTQESWEHLEPLVEVREGTYCRLCRRAARHFDEVRSAFAYCGVVRQGIYRLKFGYQGYIARYLAAYMADVYWQNPYPVDMVVAVPLHRSRRVSRGYNQSDLLARSLAERMQLDYQPKVLSKIRKTQAQTHLGEKERAANLKGAFAADKGAVAGKSILVVDDVLTTGSTMDEVARTLKKAGATHVYGLTVANVPQR